MKLPIALLLATTACASPAPGLWGAPETVAEAGGQRFRIFGPGPGGRVEAHRIDLSLPPSRRATMRNAAAAVMQATGCALRPDSIRGDAALVEMFVTCPPG